MKLWTRLFLGLAALGLVLGTAVALLQITVPRVVSRAITPDGTEMCVLQQFNWSAELFTTRFAYRKPGGSWGMFYYDHQDDFWGSSPVTLDTNAGVAVFMRSGKPAVTFAWATEAYTLHRRNSTLTNAQWKMAPGWAPGASIR